MTQQQFKDICFTSFNTDIEWFRDWTKENKSIVSYIILQGEYCKDNKKHIQGFCQFTGQKRLEQIKKFFGDNTLHIERRRGTVQQARDYCANTAEYPKEIWHEHIEYGEIQQKEQGKRNDLIKIRNDLTEGKTLTECIRDCEDDKILSTILKYSKPLTEYARQIRQINIDEELIREYDEILWNPWQQEILNLIDTIPNKRSINWIYDNVGNSGKSYLTKYLHLKKKAYVVTGGKNQDIYYGYNYQDTVIFDLSRTTPDEMNHIYNVIENFKNGYFLSTKYETRPVNFKSPHVIVMSNKMPDITKMSMDRWDIKVLNDGVLIKHDIYKDGDNVKQINSDNAKSNTDNIPIKLDMSTTTIDAHEAEIKKLKVEQLIDRKKLRAVGNPEAIKYFDRYVYNQSINRYWDTELFEYVDKL